METSGITMERMEAMEASGITMEGVEAMEGGRNCRP